jgi:hypothetical protein
MSLFNTGIRPAVDAHLLAQAAVKRDYGDYWSASAAGYCMRKQIFQRLGLPEIGEDARKQRVFSAGHIFHDWIQELTREAGLSIAQEVELQDEKLMIRGHFDDLVLVDNNLILYDYKTVNSRSFTYAKANGNTMSHYHRLQLATYMYMLRKNGITAPVEEDEDSIKTKFSEAKRLINLSEARILKISKDDLRMEEQQLLWTPELEKEIVEYWSTLNGYWASRTIPKCTCHLYEGGFLAREKFNPYFYEGKPCSLAYYTKMKEEGKLHEVA